MIFGFARIYLCKRLAKSELKLANWKLGFQFSFFCVLYISILMNSNKRLLCVIKTMLKALKNMPKDIMILQERMEKGIGC